MSRRQGYTASIFAAMITAQVEEAMAVKQKSDPGQQALDAFERELPRLWNERPGQWVAFQGARVLGFAARKHELYERCFEQGLKRDEFVIFCIEPQETEMFLGPASKADWRRAT
jgi:hypothetical protein